MSDEAREREREYQRAYYAADPDREREYHRTTVHGITRTQRNALYAAQDARCAGCREPFPDTQLEIDHDHSCCPGRWSCGRCIRGLLCRRCNRRDVLAGEPWADLQKENGPPTAEVEGPFSRVTQART